MAPLLSMLLVMVATALTSVVGLGVLVWWLRRRNIMDVPNHRSSHAVPTPRGGGLAFIPVIVAGMAAVAFYERPHDEPGIGAILEPAPAVDIDTEAEGLVPPPPGSLWQGGNPGDGALVLERYDRAYLDEPLPILEPQDQARAARPAVPLTNLRPSLPDEGTTEPFGLLGMPVTEDPFAQGMGATWDPLILATTLPAGLAALGLMLLGFLDDRRGLSPLPRLMGHVVAVALVLALMPAEARITAAPMPLVLERLVLGLAWVWFINLTNFMDGIDGLVGAQAIHVGVTVALFVPFAAISYYTAGMGLVIAGAMAGFLVWNWNPAKVFMGDSGSIPLGFLLGWVLVHVAVEVSPYALLVVPATLVGDATLTLIRRVLAGHKPWEPHREHGYQRALAAGLSPDAVVLEVARYNLVFLALGLATSTDHGLWVSAVALYPLGLLLNKQHRLPTATQREAMQAGTL